MGCAEVAYCENCGDGHGFTRCPNTGGVGPAARNGVECTEFRREVGWEASTRSQSADRALITHGQCIRIGRGPSAINANGRRCRSILNNGLGAGSLEAGTAAV
jgi:hypothetical protein